MTLPLGLHGVKRSRFLPFREKVLPSTIYSVTFYTLYCTKSTFSPHPSILISLPRPSYLVPYPHGVKITLCLFITLPPSYLIPPYSPLSIDPSSLTIYPSLVWLRKALLKFRETPNFNEIILNFAQFREILQK